MASFNKVLLMGNLTRDVESRQLPSGQTVANFGLAANRKFKTKEGEEREEVLFVDCEAWGRQAEVIQQYMTKGKPIFIEGRLKLDTWDDKETGKKQYKMKVVVEEFQFIGGRDNAGGDAGGAGGGGGAARGGRGRNDGDAPPAQRSGRGSQHVAVQEDDIPF